MVKSQAAVTRRAEAKKKAEERKRHKAETAYENRKLREYYAYVTKHLKAIDGHKGFTVEFWPLTHVRGNYGQTAELHHRGKRLGSICIDKHTYTEPAGEGYNEETRTYDRFRLCEHINGPNNLLMRETKEQFIEDLAVYLSRLV